MREVGRRSIIVFCVFVEEECEGQKENCVQFVRFYSVRLLLEHNYHIDRGMHMLRKHPELQCSVTLSGWRNLHTKELLFVLITDIIRVTWRMSSVSYESCIGEMRYMYKILVRKPLNQEMDLGIEGMVTLKTIVKNC
jgi:hypothetical protein